MSEKMARLIQVIETDCLRGKGLAGDPCRHVKQFFSVDGKLLAEVDPWKKYQHEDETKRLVTLVEVAYNYLNQSANGYRIDGLKSVGGVSVDGLARQAKDWLDEHRRNI